MEFFWKSETGNFRQTNEDKVKIIETNNFILGILCDGMGAHNNGFLASSLSIKVVQECVDEFLPPKDSPNSVLKWYQNCVKKILSAMNLASKVNIENKDMGTTLVSFLKFKNSNNVYFFNIGDSRAYVLDNRLSQVTVDQNYQNYLVKHENYSELEAKNVIGSHFLISSLGPTKISKPESFYLKDTVVKYVILTSDGIHDYLPKEEFENIILSKGTLSEKCDKIIESSLKAGSKDNLSIAILKADK